MSAEYITVRVSLAKNAHQESKGLQCSGELCRAASWGQSGLQGPQARRESLSLRDGEEGRGRAPQSINSHSQEVLPTVGTANTIPKPTVLRTGEKGPPLPTPHPHPAGGEGSCLPCEGQKESLWPAHDSVLLSHPGLGLELDICKLNPHHNLWKLA